jgi:hypothetical protein
MAKLEGTTLFNISAVYKTLNIGRPAVTGAWIMHHAVNIFVTASILTPAATKIKTAGAACSWPLTFKEPFLIRGAVQPLPYISFAFELYAFPLLVKVNHTNSVSARYCLILATIFLFPFSNFLELEASTTENEYSFGSVVASDWDTKTSVTQKLKTLLTSVSIMVTFLKDRWKRLCLSYNIHDLEGIFEMYASLLQ